MIFDVEAARRWADGPTCPPEADAWIHEACDEIERLRAAVKKWEQDYAELLQEHKGG